MNPTWTDEQKKLYRQTVAVIFGNLPSSMPIASAIEFAKERAIALIEDPDLFPS